MNSALFPEIRSHWPLFNGTGRHKGDRSAGFSQSDVRRARKLASAYSTKLLQTFSHSLGQQETSQTTRNHCLLPQKRTEAPRARGRCNLHRLMSSVVHVSASNSQFPCPWKSRTVARARCALGKMVGGVGGGSAVIKLIAD